MGSYLIGNAQEWIEVGALPTATISRTGPTKVGSLQFCNINDPNRTNAFDGITWYPGKPEMYGIYKTIGTWEAPRYQQLNMTWATGIIIDGGNIGNYLNVGTAIQPNGGPVTIGNKKLLKSNISIYGNTTIGNSDENNSLTINGNTFSSGNVGIGTTDTKGYKLAIAGSVVAESVTVKLQANWPDYTFKNDYKLLPLKEVEAFINENSHLPEVPSEAEVKNNGINIAEINATLLKKIEELTLYVIQQQKEIDALKTVLK